MNPPLEKNFHQHLLTKLREQNWVTYTEKKQSNSRPDIIIYREDVSQYIGIELKRDTSLYHMTTALKQIIKYQNVPMTPQPTLWVVAVPSFNGEREWVFERFFWRFGIGTLSSERDIITFMNEETYNKNYVIHLGNPKNSVFYWKKNTPEQTKKIVEKIQQDYVIWNVNQPR